jgi:hypothetical protein
MQVGRLMEGELTHVHFIWINHQESDVRGLKKNKKTKRWAYGVYPRVPQKTPLGMVTIPKV